MNLKTVEQQDFSDCQGKLEKMVSKEINEVINVWKALVLFRHISWILTSIFYLFNTQASFIGNKLVITFFLLIYSVLIIRVYEKSKHTIDKITVIVVDTFGIAMFLIPTGGLESEFLWYALNPIFMSAVLLSNIFCWGILTIFLVTATISSIITKDITLLDAWKQNHFVLLIFLLLTISAYIFSRLLHRLERAYTQVSALYSSSEKLLQHNTYLYQTLESFSLDDNPHKLADLLADYTRKLTDCQATLCYLDQPNEECISSFSDPNNIFSKNNDIDNESMHSIYDSFNKDGKEEFDLSFKHKETNYRLIAIPIQSVGNRFGFLGYVINNKNCDPKFKKTALFLAEMGAVVLERKKNIEVSARLQIYEEQNRIANEIHDGVSQYLFSIVYALHGLLNKKGSLQDIGTQSQLQLISNTANKAARELRASIYRISSSRRGEQVFVTVLSSYLQGLAQLNNILVGFKTEGSEEALSPALRKAIYRIVCESTSNAIRHGRCCTINVFLKMDPAEIIIKVIDDGRGFDLSKLTNKGLGLENMRGLTLSFRGRFKIISTPGQGTQVTCIVPDK